MIKNLCYILLIFSIATGSGVVYSDGSYNQNTEEEVLKITEETLLVRAQQQNKLKKADVSLPDYYTHIDKTVSLSQSPEIIYSRFIRFRSILL